MRLPNKVNRILKNGDISLTSWISILNYFQENQANLSKSQKISIYKKSEMIRGHWNKDRPYTEVLYRWNGEPMEIKKTHASLNIEIDDISPNNLYKDKTILEYLKT